MAQNFTDEVEKRIKAWFDSEIEKAPTPESKLLIERMCALVLRGGKRVRPQLLHLTYLAYNGKDEQKLVDLGVAVEFLHQYLLIHDDLIDKDIVRHKGPNIVGYYREDLPKDSWDLADDMGLLAGDLLFSFTNQIILRSDKLTDHEKTKLVTNLNDINAGVIHGQILDTYNIDAELFSEEKLLLIHYLKTSLYSVLMPMQSAAILLNLPNKEIEKIKNFARSFGLLFQLVDDYSDYFVNESVFKTTKYRDFKQGKVTYPLATSLKMVEGKDGEFIRRSAGNKKLSKGDMARVIQIMESSGVKKASLSFIKPFFDNTYKALDELSITSEGKQKFSDMIKSFQL